MRMTKYVIFKVDGVKLAIKANQLVNIIKNVHSEDIEDSGNLVSKTNIWGMSVSTINLHQLMQKNRTDKINIMLTEIITEDNKKEIIGITFDEICELAVLDDLLSYPFSFQMPMNHSYKEVIINYRDEPLTILNLSLLWKFCQRQYIFPPIFLAN
jgi:chemotaxis signal transduction protein